MASDDNAKVRQEDSLNLLVLEAVHCLQLSRLIVET